VTDRTTAGHNVSPAEIEARLHNLCGYHLAEPDPLTRYAVLTQEQALYEGLVTAIRRERGRALAEVTRSGRTLAEVAAVTRIGSGERVHRLISMSDPLPSAVPEGPTVIEGPDLVEVMSVTEMLGDESLARPVSLGSAWFDHDANWRR
jgi:hypothetical protein